MYSPSSTKSTTKTNIHSDIIETHVLTRLDAPSVASLSATSQLLNTLCSQDKVWRDLCHSMWPSTKLPALVEAIYISNCYGGGHRSFFSDSYTVLDHKTNTKYKNLDSQDHTYNSSSSELISAVDIRYKDRVLCSKANVTNTTCNDFLDSIFRVELLDCEEDCQICIPAMHEDDVFIDDLKENMTLSWILMDQTLKRAANVSSFQPVSVRRHWDGGNVEVKYATIVGGRDWHAEFRVVVMLKWKGVELEIKSVKLQMFDIDQVCLNGKQSLMILQDSIKSGKRVKRKRGEMTELHRKFVIMKRHRREAIDHIRKNRGTGGTSLVSISLMILGLIILSVAYICMA